VLRDAVELLDDRLVRLAGFGGEAGEDGAGVAGVGGGVLVDGAGEEAFAERAERDEADAEFLQRGQYVCFWLSGPQRVLGLQGGDRLDGVGATDRGGAGVGQAEVADLALGDESLTVPATSSIGRSGSGACW